MNSWVSIETKTKKPESPYESFRMNGLDKPDAEFNNIRDYIPEAGEFLRKFSSRKNNAFEPHENNDTKILSMLWAEADKYDELVLSMFSSFSQLLGENNSKSDTSRGVIESDDEVQPSFYFHCTWELIKGGDRLITVTLSSENYKFQPMFRVRNCSLQTDQFLSVRSEGIHEKLRQLITESAIMEFDLEILSRSPSHSDH